MKVARALRPALLAILTSAGLLSTPVAHAAPPGLVGAYGFEEASGTAVTDASGSGNAGTISGAARSSAGKYGSALSFDGVNDRVTIPDASSLDLTTAMTLEAWVKPSGSSWRTVLLKERPGGLAYALYSSTDTGRPSAEIDAAHDVQARGPAALPANTWSHLAATYDGAALKLFVNGAQVASKAATGSIAVSSGALRIGGNAVWGEYFKGLIDEVRVYNRALPAAEIQADMAAADTTPPSVTITRGCTTQTIHDYIDVWATVTDDRPGVMSELQIDGVRVGAPVAGSIAREWESKTVANGAHVLSVVARDAAGNETTKSCDITVHNPAVTVGISSPADGATVSGVVTLGLDPRADGDPITGFPMTAIGVTIPGGGPVAGEPRSLTRTWDTTGLPDGVYTITANLYWMDYSAPRATKTIQVTVDNTAPSVSLQAGCNGATLSELVGPISGTATDASGSVDVKVKVDGTQIYSRSGVDGSFSFTWNTRAFADGPHTMQVIATDVAGNAKTLDCPWNVDNKALSVPLVIPSSPLSGTVTIGFQPKADGVDVSRPVQLYIDGVLVANTSSAPYTYSWDTTALANGSHTIEARMFWPPYGTPQATSTQTVTVSNPLF